MDTTHLKTIVQLEKYLELNGYSFTELSIGKHRSHEGVIIEEINGCYNYSYSERGEKRIIKSFNKEYDLVQYAIGKLLADEWSRAHLVAATFYKDEIAKAEYELKKMHIDYRRNDIPNYKIGQTKYRIFVFGIDINMLVEFKKMFLH